MQATLDATADGILVVNLAGIINGYNRRFVKLWKLPDEILESRDDNAAIQFVLDQFNNPKSFTDKISELYSHPESKSFDVLYLKDGRVIERYSRPQVLEGVPVGRVWSFRDVTEMHRLNKELLEQKFLLDILLKTIPDNIYFKDIDSRFVRISDAMARYFSLSDPSDVVGKTDADFFTREHAGEALECEQEIMRTGKGVDNLEEKETWLDGRLSWTSTSKLPLVNESGAIVGTFGISRDITRRKQTEKALEEANRTKDKFISIIAHDLRNPIGNIMGMSELALGLLENMDQELLRKYLHIIQSRSYQTYNLLENLLNWARTQQGGMDVHPELTDLAGIVEKEIEFHSDIARQKNIVVRSGITSPCFGMVDQNMIRTVFRNLIDNALKFTLSGGHVQIDCVSADTGLTFSVTDNGTGIPVNIARDLFRTDSKFTSTGTLGEHGSGLGLSLCQDFVARHGGTISVESKVDIGSVFSFILPKTG